MDQATPLTPEPETSSPVVQEAGSVLALGVEVHRLTACLLEPVSNRYRLTAWWIAPSGLQRTVSEQIEDMCARFGKRMQRRLWDAEREIPFTYSNDPVRYPPLEHVTIAASPRPRLRVWVAGLTAHNSLAAAIGALQASQVQIMGSTALHAENDPDALARELNAGRPEALVLAGGYDTSETGAQRSLAMLTHHIAAALHSLREEAVPDILYAGNRFAYREVFGILQAARRCTIIRVDNVLPVPDRARVQALSQAADELYWRKCERIRDFARLKQWATDPAQTMTIESSFARLVQLWTQLHDLPELHGVYAGSDRWLHVWADANSERVLARFVSPGADLRDLASWPPVKLVSGPWKEAAEMPRSVLWWDSSGLAPVTAAAARVAPRAAVEAIQTDLLMGRGD